MKSEIIIGNRVIGIGQAPYIIAEMACAHNGDEKQAIALIDAASLAGADAVQLQFFRSDFTVTPQHEVHGILKSIEFDDDTWTRIFHYAKDKNIHVFVCTYDIPSVELAVGLGADGIKLNSADLNNPDVLAAVGRSGIPFTLGTGASTLEEIANGLRIARENGAQQIILMHGVQNFPTRNEDLNISRIGLLKDVFGIPTGYHDHTDGNDPFTLKVDLIAIGLGACVIEKHITLSREAKGIDWQAALEPDEFKLFVNDIHRAFEAYGSREIKAFTESDLRYRKFQKKSIVAKMNLKKGDILTKDKVVFIRNVENGISPYSWPQFEGKTLKTDLSIYCNLLPEHV